MTTPRLGAPELVSGQATPETTVNEQIRYLESGAGHFIFKDRDLATPPGSPADGDCYLVAASATGDWAGEDGNIAFRVNSAWAFIMAIEGFTAWVNDENVFIGYDGASWSTLSAPSGAVLTSANNLSDVADAATSRTNIDVYSTGEVDAAIAAAAPGASTESFIVACSDETTALTTGTAKVTFRMPYAFTVTAVRASVNTAPTGSTLNVDINEGGVSILSTVLTIDAGEKTSTTAATPVVISDASLADDAEITIDIDQVGSTVAGKGLKVVIIGHQ